MTISITITAANATEVRAELQALLHGNAPVLGRVVEAATVGESVLPTGGETIDVGYDAAAAAESEASKVEVVTPIKKSRKKAAPVEVPAAAPTVAPVEEDEVITGEVIKAAEEIVAAAKLPDREDVKAMMKHLHQEEGDTFIPKVLEVLAQFGVKAQRDVAEKDLPALYEKLCELKKTSVAKN
jgi:alpha-beta hydrolase superfamily lysophospholipase